MRTHARTCDLTRSSDGVTFVPRGPTLAARSPVSAGIRPPSGMAGHDFSRVSVFSHSAETIQAKLAINSPVDVYEREADDVGEHVMRMPEIGLRHGCACGGGFPKCQTRPRDQDTAGLRLRRVRAGTAGQSAAPSLVDEVLRAPGRPLDAQAKAFFEPRFGHDFSRVRIHADAKAAESARALHAKAYTVGREIVFGAGECARATDQGRRLLAHELTHVIQQRPDENSVSNACGRNLVVQRQEDTDSQSTADDYEENTVRLSNSDTVNLVQHAPKTPQHDHDDNDMTLELVIKMWRGVIDTYLTWIDEELAQYEDHLRALRYMHEAGGPFRARTRSIWALVRVKKAKARIKKLVPEPLKSVVDLVDITKSLEYGAKLLDAPVMGRILGRYPKMDAIARADADKDIGARDLILEHETPAELQKATRARAARVLNYSRKMITYQRGLERLSRQRSAVR